MILVLIGCLVIGSTSGARLKRMVGSKEISILEAPYQVSLRFNGIHVCGGVLISSKHVLTAAHCLDGLFDEPYDELTAVTGTDNLKKGGQVHKVADVKCHPKFVADAKEYYNHDIAVVTLQRDIKLGKTQQALTLPNHDVVNGTSGHVSGFGRTVTLNPYPSTTLRALKATVLTVNACKPFAVDNKILDNQVCGIQERGIGICKGDSGGPLVIDGKLAGIASWNRQEPDGCGSGVPDVYTNVFRYLDFIRLCTKK